MGIWKPTNDSEYYSNWVPAQKVDLYHYGVKGMKWKNKKGEETPAPGSFAAEEAQYAYDQGAFNRAYLKKKEESKPEWQKKWEKSSAKKELKRIFLTAKKNLRPKSRKRNVTSGGSGVKLRKKLNTKSHLSVKWDDGSTSKIR